MTSLGKSVFQGCTSLTSITIPNSLINIDEFAFYNCSSLKSVTIPTSVRSIGDCAFSKCSSLSSLTIPNSVKSIGKDIFDSPVNTPSIDPNSMSWPKPSYETKWESKGDGTKEKLVKFGEKQTTIKYYPSIKRYGVERILLALYTNYNDAEAAAYFDLVHGLRRSRGLDNMFKK